MVVHTPQTTEECVPVLVTDHDYFHLRGDDNSLLLLRGSAAYDDLTSKIWASGDVPISNLSPPLRPEFLTEVSDRE